MCGCCRRTHFGVAALLLAVSAPPSGPLPLAAAGAGGSGRIDGASAKLSSSVLTLEDERATDEARLAPALLGRLPERGAVMPAATEIGTSAIGRCCCCCCCCRDDDSSAPTAAP